MNPFEIIKLSKKLAWVGELVEKANKFVEPDKYKALLSEIVKLGDELRQKIDELTKMVREDAEQLGFIADLPQEPSDDTPQVA